MENTDYYEFVDTTNGNLDKSWLLFACVILLFATYIYLWLVRRPSHFSKCYTLVKIPLLGNKWGLRRPGSAETEFHSAASIFENVGSTFIAWRWNKPIVFVADATNVQKILSQPSQLERGRYGLQECEWMVGKGLLTSQGKVWKSDRKTLTQSFHRSKMITNHLPIFHRGSEALMANLQNMENSDETISVDIEQLVNEATFSNMFESIFGIRPEPDENIVERYFTASKLGDQVTRVRVMKPYISAVPILWKLFGHADKQEFVLKSVKDLLMPRILERQRLLQTDPDADGGLLCDAFFKTETNLEVLFHHVVSLFIAGSDTTTNLVVHTLHQLALNPSIQADVLDELDAVFSDKESMHQVETGHLAELKLLERCMKETLRLYPPASTTSRKLVEGIVLDDGTKLESGCEVRIFMCLLHQNPNYFTNPETFDPDRFLPENCASRHPYAYIPFAMGPRNCVGNRYAMDEAKILLVQILGQFRVASCQRGVDHKEPAFKLNFTLQTLNPIMLALTRREST